MKHYLKTFMMLSAFYFRQVWKELPFIIIVICGLGLQLAFTLMAKGAYEAEVYPATYEILGIIRRFQPALLVLVVLYSGELFARERTLKISPLMEVLPYKTGTRLFSQVLAMNGILVSLLLAMIMVGIATQWAFGYQDIDYTQYFFTCFTELLFNGAFMITLAFFIHVLVNHKFLGHALGILLIIAQNYLPAWGLEHKLYQYGKQSLGIYSDLTGYQSNSLQSFLYYTIYWLGMALLIDQLSKLFVIRGIETGIKSRVKLAITRWRGTRIVFSLTGLLALIGAGIYIYHNTAVINVFQTRRDVEQSQYKYEKLLKEFEKTPQPEIKGVSIEADLFPDKDRYKLRGKYVMINPGAQPISEIHIQEDFDPKVSTQALSFDQKFTLKEAFPRFKFSIYKLAAPLLPGDSLMMEFEMRYGTEGFSQSRRQELAQNASFFTQAQLPSLGYAADYELEALPTRRQFGLPPKDRLPEIETSAQYHLGLNAANNINFEAVLSTAAGYHATTSGELINQWSENGRAHFHYKSKAPIENQYAIITGKLNEQVHYLTQGTDSIQLSLLYHPAHTHNLGHITRAMNASFTNFQHSFSPYQYDRMTIMEVPRLHDFAMSVPNTIAFSEAMGFMTKPESGGLNVPFYITAHEIAHQWWGDQIRGAIVKGEDMITETLAQYGAGMVTLQEFGEESLSHILKYERGRYLRGRKRESQQEQPLYKAEKQAYIHYGKGLISMMALRHYISEDSVNAALRRVIRDFPASKAIYPNSLDVIAEFRKSTADSLQYLVTDLFERIIFLENRIQHAESRELSEGGYELTLDLITEKYEADINGLLQPIPIHDWIELAVYGADAEGKETELYRQMHKFDQSASHISINLDQSVVRVVIDPASILMDRNQDDNEWRF